MHFSIAFSPSQPRLILAVGAANVVIKDKYFLAFCALMTAGDGAYLYRSDIGTLPGWRNNLADSVGKQMARWVKSLAAIGLPVIEAHQKTNGWRLRPDGRANLTEPDLAAARAALEAANWHSWARFAGTSAHHLSNWFVNASQAMLAGTQGLASDGIGYLKAANAASDDSNLREIADMLGIRLGQQLPTPHATLPVVVQAEQSVFSFAIAARKQAAMANHARSEDWPMHLHALEQLLPLVISRGDMTSAAIVLNVMALLQRRLGDFEAALITIKEAAPLAVFSGDLALVQNVAFNFGNILSERHRLDPSAAIDGDFVAMLQLDIDMRHRLGIGRDSAQTELLIAYLCWERGDWSRVEIYLADAYAIISVSRKLSDLALYHRVRGLLRTSANEPTSDIYSIGLDDLAIAKNHFISLGNSRSADYVSNELAKLSAQKNMAILGE